MDFSGLLDAGFLGDLLRVIIEVVMVIVGLVLTPISAIIANLMPDLDEALLQLPAVFAYASQYLGWIVSALALPGLLLTLVVAYYSFTITSKLTAWPIKLAISWYRSIK